MSLVHKRMMPECLAVYVQVVETAMPTQWTLVKSIQRTTNPSSNTIVLSNTISLFREFEKKQQPQKNKLRISFVSWAGTLSFFWIVGRPNQTWVVVVVQEISLFYSHNILRFVFAMFYHIKPLHFCESDRFILVRI